MAYIGVGLHTSSFAICRLESEGGETFETFQLCAADLDRFCLSLSADDEIAVEATGNPACFHGEVVSCVGRVVIVNPGQFQVIRKSVRKTDKNDARSLALFLSKDMLPETRLKSKAPGELASLTHTRDLLVKQRTRLLNRINALYNRQGIKVGKEKFTSKRALAKLDMAPFPDPGRIEVGIIRDQTLHLTAALVGIDRHVERFAEKGYEGLISIKGARSAAVFLSAIGDVSDFGSEDRLAACFGIVPRVSQSNETDHRGRDHQARQQAGADNAGAMPPSPSGGNPVLRLPQQLLPPHQGPPRGG